MNSTGRRNTSMMRCCDGETETETVRPSRSVCDAFARSPASREAGGATTVLEGDRPGAVEGIVKLTKSSSIDPQDTGSIQP